MKNVKLNVPLVMLVTAAAISGNAAAAPSVTAKEQRENKPGDGTVIIDTSIQLTAERVQNNNGKEIGAKPNRFVFWLWGKAGSEDKIVVTWKRGGKKIGKPTECPVPDVTEEQRGDNWDDLGQVQCDVKDEVVFPGPGVYSADIGLRSTETQKITPLRTLTFNLQSYPTTGNSTGWYVDRDGALKENFAYWKPDSELLVLRTWTKQKPGWHPGEGKVKCTVDGKPATQVGGVSSSDSFEYSDTKDKGASWVQLEGTFYNNEREKQGWVPGKYECKMLVAGKVLRTFRFELEKNLKIAVSPQQAGIVSRSTYLPNVDIPAGADAPFDAKALPFYGKSLK